MSRFDARIIEIKNKFRELDINKDNMLDYDELKEFLRSGRSDVKERDLKWTFSEIDKTGRGKINFGEFVDWIYAATPGAGKVARFHGRSASSTTQARHGLGDHYRDPAGEEEGKFSLGNALNDHLASIAEREEMEARRRQGAVALSKRLPRPESMEKEEVDWSVIEQTYSVYAGMDQLMQGNEFARLCRDCNFYDEYFSPGDSESVFRRCCARGEKHMKKKGFRQAFELISAMKGVPAASVRNAVLHAAPAPAPPSQSPSFSHEIGAFRSERLRRSRSLGGAPRGRGGSRGSVGEAEPGGNSTDVGASRWPPQPSSGKRARQPLFAALPALPRLPFSKKAGAVAHAPPPEELD